MPAKKLDSVRYKSYIGRFFILRQHKRIPVSREKFGINNRYYVAWDDIGNVGFIFDETHSRVKIVGPDGNFIWIPKFYLLKEVIDETWRDFDSLTDSIDIILNQCIPQCTTDEQRQTLLKCTATLRRIADQERPHE